MTVPFREATIDLDAIADNVRHFRRLTGVEVIAIVKANAYGHGAASAAVAALSAGATRIGVAEIPEALELRRQGVHAPIMAWLHAPGRGSSTPRHRTSKSGSPRSISSRQPARQPLSTDRSECT